MLNAKDIPISEIMVDNDFNCRGKEISMGDIAQLAEDIRVHGALLHPVIVRELRASEKEFFPQFNYKLVAGFRRTMACKLLKRETIEATIRDLDDNQEMLLNLAENLNRKDLTYLQEAKTVQKFIDKGMSEQYIAEKLGESVGWVELRLKLLGLPAEVQILINNKAIPLHAIRKLDYIQREVGLVATLKEAATIRDLVAAGHTPDDAMPKKPKDSRRKGNIALFTMQGRIRDANSGNNNMLTRLLGWVAGTVSTTEIETELKEIYPNFEVEGE